jgi:ureidoglycolate lyase
VTDQAPIVVRVEQHGTPSGLANRLAPLCRLVSRGQAPPEAVNQGRGLRHSIGTLAHAPGLALNIALFEVAPGRLPFRAELLERHAASEQLIQPIRAACGWIALLAPDLGGQPDLQRLVAVHLRSDQGIVYGRGVWHLPILAIGTEPSLFLVQSMQAGSPTDTVEKVLKPHLILLDGDVPG